MRRIYLQVVDTATEVSQNGTVEENIEDNDILKVQDALQRFGIHYHNVSWCEKFTLGNLTSSPTIMTGFVDGTNKIVNIIAI
jgi:hypothetical protein